MIIFKDRSEAAAWIVYHKNIGNGGGLKLDTNAAKFTESTLFNNTSPTSSVFTVGTSTNVNKDGNKYVAYCFAPVKGYSMFGTYKAVGNNNDTSACLIYSENMINWYDGSINFGTDSINDNAKLG